MELSLAFHQCNVEEKILKLASGMRYDRGAKLVSDLTGVPASNRHTHDRVEQVVQLSDPETVFPDRREIRRRIKQAKKDPDDRTALVVALDDAHTPTRSRAKRDAKRGPGKWREIKGVRLYLAPEDGRNVLLASWHKIQGAEAMKQDLQRIDYDACNAEGPPVGSGGTEPANRFISHA